MFSRFQGNRQFDSTNVRVIFIERPFNWRSVNSEIKRIDTSFQGVTSEAKLFVILRVLLIGEGSVPVRVSVWPKVNDDFIKFVWRIVDVLELFLSK